MIIICNKQKLQDGISICQKAITGKSTMPILEGIYMIYKYQTLKQEWQY